MALLLKGFRKAAVVAEGNIIKISNSASVFSTVTQAAYSFDEIESVQVKKPGLLSGFIQFTINGEGKPQPQTTLSKSLAASHDENAVVFSGEANYQIALKIKDHVENHIIADSFLKEEELSADELSKQDAWNNIAANELFVLIIFFRGKHKTVDVAKISEAHFNSSHQLRIVGQFPQLVKDELNGDSLDWVTSFNIAASKIIYHEVLDRDCNMIQTYKAAGERGLKIAETL